eukprot:TRINITY_DN30726_c0_g1_i1.p1 TRINITY_DN30726_c0_g1~~TRINITY_DN30726_c0_g1_i1.p1  ORF type:complete len:464 (+),score=175.60 TRINITY_DN30726_c0_g1_i1:171-1394(+)
MVASRDIAKGDVFLHIPEQALFRWGVEDGVCEGAEGSHGLFQRLALKLLRARNATDADELTQTWIAMLPRKFHVIVTWAEDAIRQLGTPLRMKMAERLQKELSDGYASFQSVAPDVAYEDYCWAQCVIQTRGFVYNEVDWTLIPYADMFNHSPEGNARFEMVNGGYTFTADRAYSKGEEVLLKYNASGGWDQMASYGFLDQGGRNATFPFCIPRVPEEWRAASHPSDLDLFKAKAVDDASRAYHLTLNGPTPATLDALRLRFLSHSDPVHFSDLRSGQVSMENEYHCWLYVYTFCRGALRSFVFSAAEDERFGREGGNADGADADAATDTDPNNINLSLAVAVRTTDRLILKTVKEIARRRYTQLARELLLLQQQEDDPSEEAVRGAQKLAKEVQLIKALSSQKAAG